jgi:hypothetical protein
MSFQTFGFFAQTFAANSLSRPFRVGDFQFGRPFAAVALSLQNFFRTQISWSFEAVLCSDAASLLYPPAATFTTLSSILRIPWATNERHLQPSSVRLRGRKSEFLIIN